MKTAEQKIRAHLRLSKRFLLWLNIFGAIFFFSLAAWSLSNIKSWHFHPMSDAEQTLLATTYLHAGKVEPIKDSLRCEADIINIISSGGQAILTMTFWTGILFVLNVRLIYSINKETKALEKLQSPLP